jgi:hypothetical protein
MYDESLTERGMEESNGPGIEDHVILQFHGAFKSLTSIHSANQHVNIGLMLRRTVCRFSSMVNTTGRTPLVAVVGATGTGKSEVSLDIFW